MTAADALLHGPGLWGLAFTLGFRHGLDADHLATVDGLTRYNAEARPSLARWCGILFALGHGAVLIVAGLLMEHAASHIVVPEWTRIAGALTSIALLTALGLLNLVGVIRTPRDRVVTLVGIRTWLPIDLVATHRPLTIVGVGALFAISFDTLSQAVLLSTAAGAAGMVNVAGLVGVFVLGMSVADGLNGIWMATMLTRTDRHARAASRIMGLVVAILSLSVAAMGCARLASPTLDVWIESRHVTPGIAVMALIGLAFIASLIYGSHYRRQNISMRREILDSVRN